MAQVLSNLPVGAKIKFGKHQINTEAVQPIIWVVADKNHSGYPSDSVTLITEKIIDLRPADGAEANSSSGNNNYALSNINQWLNSSASAGAWYSATHANDAPPTSSNTLYGTEYQSRPGFLYNFTDYERLSILPTTLTNQIGSDVTNKFTANVFLPSVWEIRGTGDIVDGSTRLSYFNSNAAQCLLTSQCFNNTLLSEKNYTITDYWEYTTRTPSSSQFYNITNNGGSGPRQANAPKGIRPVVNLSSTAKISNTTDADGCYTLVVNNKPKISGSNSTLGNKDYDFSISYSVTDADGEPITVHEYLDNVVVRSYVATSGATNNFNVTGNTWLKLINGSHTLKIVATDGFDTDTRTYTFTKSVSKLIVQRTTPIEASTMPTRLLVTLVKNIPYNAILTVEACNNGFDASPTWENIGTSSVSSGLAHVFSNKVKTAGKWGVNIRVTVDRNGGEGACYISEIGGNFE